MISNESEAMLWARDISFSRNQSRLIDRVSVQIPKGALVALIGPNGAGKTTLLRLLSGILEPDVGSVLLGGRDLKQLSRKDIARSLAYVPQDTSAQFEVSVRDAVALGRFPYTGVWRAFQSHDWEVVDDALELMGIAHLSDRRLPTLSGGERQRAFLARAIAQESPLLLLDEPTASLDIGHQLELLEFLCERHAAGQTIVVAMHDLPSVWEHFGRAVLLENGSIVADGATAEVLSGDAAERAFGVSFSEVDGRLCIALRH